MSPGAKVSPRPTGGSSRESLENRYCEGKQMTTTEYRRLVRPQHHRKMCTTAADGYREGNLGNSPSCRVKQAWPLGCLRRMCRKMHVRCLEGWGRATVPGYSATFK